MGEFRPLEGYVEDIRGSADDELMWYQAEGHVDKQVFLDEVNLEFEEAFELEDVEYGYIRTRPGGECGYVELSKDGEPVTLINVDKWFKKRLIKPKGDLNG